MIDVEVCRGFAYNTAFLASEGVMFGLEGSMTKLFASEAYKQHTKWFIDMCGPEGMLHLDNDDAPLGGIDYDARHAPVTTIYGGTSEINRNNLIAEATWVCPGPAERGGDRTLRRVTATSGCPRRARSEPRPCGALVR
jgi:alkylation response protein AidB-like acyl-CoA dehydrogenase